MSKFTPNHAAPTVSRTSGTVAAHLTAARIADAHKRAVAANVGVAPITDTCVMGEWHADPFGPRNAKNGSVVRMARWYVAWVATCIVYGLPKGSVYVPCYLCGQVFDAYQLDGEHVGGRLVLGTYDGGLLLACSPCNRHKGDHGQIAHQSRAKVRRMTAGIGWPETSTRRTNATWRVFHARDRRK